MCEIGKPIEIIDSRAAVIRPAPLRRETEEQPAQRPVTVEVPVAVEPVTVRSTLSRSVSFAAAALPHARYGVNCARCPTPTSSRSRLSCVELECRGRHVLQRGAVDAQRSIRSHVSPCRGHALDASRVLLGSGEEVLGEASPPRPRPGLHLRDVRRDQHEAPA